MADLQWYAVRTFTRDDINQPWGPHDLQPGEFAYEERITLWRTISADTAIALAENDAEQYVEATGGLVLDLTQVYTVGNVLDQGVEAFSLIRKSSLMPDDYLDRHFDTGTEYQSRTTDDYDAGEARD